MSFKTTIPKGVWALGFVSMFMDISSEIIHGLLPVFLVTVIGASVTTVGFIEGIGEATALITRVFSGAISDWLGKRKALVVAGYLLGTLTKPLFAIANTAALVFTARSLDRFGKGLRGAPRDALIADLTPANARGAAYGLRQSLDSAGAFIGPLLAIVLMAAMANDFRGVFWLAIIPGLIAVTVLIFFVKEPEKCPGESTPKPKQRVISFSQVSNLGIEYWTVVAVGVVFTLARFSEAFLILRAQNLGMSPQWIPSILMIMSLFFALGAYPAGHLSDRVGRTIILSIGLVFLIAADLVLALANNLYLVIVGASLWGLHMAFTQGLFSALIADTSGEKVKGTAFGIFGLATGIAVLMASVIAGWLWDQYGAPVTFITGAAFSLVTFLGLLKINNSKIIK